MLLASGPIPQSVRELARDDALQRRQRCRVQKTDVGAMREIIKGPSG